MANNLDTKMTDTEADGVVALCYLHEITGTKLSADQALINWRSMSEEDRQKQMNLYRLLYQQS